MRNLSFAFLLIAILTTWASAGDHSERRINSALVTTRWKAEWICHPETDPRDYGIFHFRKSFELQEIPITFIIHLSADNGYQLFVNGQMVCSGPVPGALDRWYFDSIDIAEYLKLGKNTVAATVWNLAEYRPWFQISNGCGFILQGNTAAEAAINTGNTWRVIVNRSYSPLITAEHEAVQYVIIGARERVVGEKYPWGWQQIDYDDSTWLAAATLGPGEPRGVLPRHTARSLSPRQIPFMEHRPNPPLQLRHASSLPVHNLFLNDKQDLKIPPHQEITLILDQGELTTAYPELTVSGGKGSKITLIYAEAPRDTADKKSNRGQLEGMKIVGYHDEFWPDGGSERLFRPLRFRTFRYIKMKVETAADTLLIHHFGSRFTAFPLREKAEFHCDDSTLKRIWETGWRTIRLCAHETYFDSPYYEQLQYVGDTRIQGLLFLTISGENRLLRQAILHFADSVQPEGLTLSRYPAWRKQLIPTYSLLWIAMVHDYLWYGDGPEFVQQFLGAIQRVIGWFEGYRSSEKNMLAALPHWNFVDWTAEWHVPPETGNLKPVLHLINWLRIKFFNAKMWESGEPPAAVEGNSAILSLFYEYALQRAADIFKFFEQEQIYQQYQARAEQIKQVVNEKCWDAERQLVADSPRKKQFSQHANILAVLCNMRPDSENTRIMQRVLRDSSLIQASIYFRFYLQRALKKPVWVISSSANYSPG